MQRKNFLLIGGFAVVGAACLIAVLMLARTERAEPQRCAPGLAAMGARCCGVGQRLDGEERCVGKPTTCAIGMRLTDAGCVATVHRVPIPAGTFDISIADWEANMTSGRRRVTLKGFQVDSHEVLVFDWQRCTAAGRCAALQDEPGRPVRGVAAKQAAQYCAWVGGRLPTLDEWLVTAVGATTRRFPWGATGLVCRRASFGLSRGPCANGAKGPELAGARPDGATPEGVQDMAGNVAEWATTQPDGAAVALGGSFVSRLAAELKPAANPVQNPDLAHTGFRCVYP